MPSVGPVSTGPAVQDGACPQGLPAHPGTPPRRRGTVGFSFMALEGTETKTRSGAAAPAPGTAEPQAPQAEKEPRSRARTCHGRGDFNNLSEILLTNVSL